MTDPAQAFLNHGNVDQVAAATAGAKAADVARAIVRPLEALTGGSTSAATRSALLAIRDELDRLIEG